MWNLCTVKKVIRQICSNRPKNKVPQSARLSDGGGRGGVQSLFGQCPIRGCKIFNGASVRPFSCFDTMDVCVTVALTVRDDTI